MRSAAAVSLTDVHVALGRREVLGGVELHVGAGERVAIVGGNGVGKSTLLDVVLGIRPVDRGRVAIDGGAPGPSGVGHVPQDPGASLLPWFRARRNVLLPLECRGASPAEQARALDRVRRELDPERTLDMEAHPETLSGGQRQLVALMRGLVARPRLLLCDEPLSAMDAPARVRLRASLARVCGGPDGPTLIAVTHDVDDMVELADRVLVLAGRPARVVQRIETARPGAREAIGAALFDGAPS